MTVVPQIHAGEKLGGVKDLSRVLGEMLYYMINRFQNRGVIALNAEGFCEARWGYLT